LDKGPTWVSGPKSRSGPQWVGPGSRERDAPRVPSLDDEGVSCILLMSRNGFLPYSPDTASAVPNGEIRAASSFALNSAALYSCPFVSGSGPGVGIRGSISARVAAL
jgi:hypothetical protein